MHTSLSLDINTSTNIYFLNFNQTHSCFCIGTDKGYQIYKCDPIKRVLQKMSLQMEYHILRCLMKQI